MVKLDVNIVNKSMPDDICNILFANELWLNTNDLKKEHIGFVPIWVITEEKEVIFVYEERTANGILDTLKSILFNPVDSLIIDMSSLRFFQNFFFQED